MDTKWLIPLGHSSGEDGRSQSRQDCLSELPKLFYGTLRKNAKFYIRDQSLDSYLECIGVYPDEDRTIQPRMRGD